MSIYLTIYPPTRLYFRRLLYILHSRSYKNDLALAHGKAPFIHSRSSAVTRTRWVSHRIAVKVISSSAKELLNRALLSTEDCRTNVDDVLNVVSKTLRSALRLVSDNPSVDYPMQTKGFEHSKPDAISRNARLLIVFR